MSVIYTVPDLRVSVHNMSQTIDRQRAVIAKLTEALERITTFREGYICQQIATEALAAVRQAATNKTQAK